MTDQAKDSSGDRAEAPRKRTLYLGRPPQGDASPPDDPKKIEQPIIDVCNDIYDDIDDIDDLDAFEMANGLRNDEPKSSLEQQAGLPAFERDDRQVSPLDFASDRLAGTNQEPRSDSLFRDDHDIQPVPLKSKMVTSGQPDRQETGRSHGLELRFDSVPIEKTSAAEPDNARKRHADMLSEDVFSETAKLLEATTPSLQTSDRIVQQPDKRLRPRITTPHGPGFTPVVAPEEAQVTNANGSNVATANGPADISVSPVSPADIAPRPLPPRTSLPQSEPSPDVLPALMIAEGPRLRRFAAAMIGDEGVADQLVETTLLQAFANPGDLAADGELGVYLLTMLYQRRRETLQRSDPLLMPSLTPDFDGVLFQRLQGAERDEIREFAEAIGSLGEEDRAILLLIALENLSYREVAEIIRIPVGRVMVKIAHAREQLRQALKAGAAESHGSPSLGDIA